MQKSKSSKKPFVKPSLTEEASLQDVTLISGGGIGHGGGSNKLGRGGHGKNKNAPKHTNTHGHGRKS